MLEVNNIECVKGYEALFSGFNLRIKPAQIVQISGENGVGKTSLLRIISGLSYPAQGDVLWEGESIYKQPTPFQIQLAYLGHLNALKSGLTALENLKMQQSMLSVANRFSPEDALSQTGLNGYEHITTYQLSAGQKRRVAIARLLLSSAKLWILDEPITALDKAGAKVFESMIEKHIQQGGMAIVTSHQTLHFPQLDFRQVSLN